MSLGSDGTHKGPLTPDEAARLASEAVAAAVAMMEARHATLQHCQYWSWHKRKLLCYNDWIKETWDDEVTA